MIGATHYERIVGELLACYHRSLQFPHHQQQQQQLQLSQYGLSLQYSNTPPEWYRHIACCQPLNTASSAAPPFNRLNNNGSEVTLKVTSSTPDAKVVESLQRHRRRTSLPGNVCHDAGVAVTGSTMTSSQTGLSRRGGSTAFFIDTILKRDDHPWKRDDETCLPGERNRTGLCSVRSGMLQSQLARYIRYS
jgi:hypothetical protein